MQVRALSVLGRNETAKGRESDDVEGPSWQGPMQREIHTSRGPHWNKQSYAVCVDLAETIGFIQSL